MTKIQPRSKSLCRKFCFPSFLSPDFSSLFSFLPHLVFLSFLKPSARSYLSISHFSRRTRFSSQKPPFSRHLIFLSRLPLILLFSRPNSLSALFFFFSFSLVSFLCSFSTWPPAAAYLSKLSYSLTEALPSFFSDFIPLSLL